MLALVEDVGRWSSIGTEEIPVQSVCFCIVVLEQCLYALHNFMYCMISQGWRGAPEVCRSEVGRLEKTAAVCGCTTVFLAGTCMVDMYES